MILRIIGNLTGESKSLQETTRVGGELFLAVECGFEIVGIRLSDAQFAQDFLSRGVHLTSRSNSARCRKLRTLTPSISLTVTA
jgi:hypothetical protein